MPVRRTTTKKAATAKAAPAPATEKRPDSGPRGRVPPRPEQPIDITGVYEFVEAAGYLRISVTSLRQLVDSGRINHLRVNQKARRILGRHILDFQERQSRGTTR